MNSNYSVLRAVVLRNYSSCFFDSFICRKLSLRDFFVINAALGLNLHIKLLKHQTSDYVWRYLVISPLF